VALVRADVSEELSASFIRVTRISDLGTTLAVATNARYAKFLQNVGSYKRHGRSSKKTPFFIVTSVKTSNLTQHSTMHIDAVFHLIYRIFQNRLISILLFVPGLN
jgi:hypothetical protein